MPTLPEINGQTLQVPPSFLLPFDEIKHERLSLELGDTVGDWTLFKDPEGRLGWMTTLCRQNNRPLTVSIVQLDKVSAEVTCFFPPLHPVVFQFSTQKDFINEAANFPDLTRSEYDEIQTWHINLNWAALIRKLRDNLPPVRTVSR
jgi:hypothetical protein